jgi:hypothetical protein
MYLNFRVYGSISTESKNSTREKMERIVRYAGSAEGSDCYSIDDG